MKTLSILTILCGLLLAGSTYAQTKISFTYDDAGNMTSRKIIDFSIPPLPEQVNEDSNNSEENEDNITEFVDEIFNDKLGDQDIVIYPNPTKGKLIVAIPDYEFGTNDRIDVISMQGSLLKRITPLSSSNTVSLTDYANATYILLIQIDGKVTEWKIIKQ